MTSSDNRQNTMPQNATPPYAPTIGRIVHFYDKGESTPLPAIVVEVMTSPSYVDLHVFGVSPKVARRTTVCYDDDIARTAADGPRWCYPPRV